MNWVKRIWCIDCKTFVFDHDEPMCECLEEDE